MLFKIAAVIIRRFTYFLAILLFTSCTKENAFDCFKSNGKDITEVRYPGGFNALNVYDKMEVLITQGEEYKVEVTAGKNIIKNITSKIKDSILSLDNFNKCNFVRGYKRKIRVKITVPHVYQVNNYGVGPITFAEDFKQDVLSVRAENSGDTYIQGTYREVNTSSHGNGDIYLNGTAKDLKIYSFGTNYTRAENFKVTNYMFISNNSIGDAYLNMDSVGLLQYYIHSDGNIYLKGTHNKIENLGDNSAKGKIIWQN